MAGDQVASDDGLCVCPDSASLLMSGRCVTPLILIAVILPPLLLAAAVLLLIRSNRTDAERSLLLDEMARLRKRLRLQWRDGFVLSSEWYPAWLSALWLRRPATCIQTKHLEAAARLSLMRDDFEPSGLDLLGVVLQDCETQRLRLREWLLELCTALIDPKLTEQDAGVTRRTSFESVAFFAVRTKPVDTFIWSQQARFDYFRSKVCRLLLWLDDGGSLLDDLKRIASGLMDEMAGLYETRYVELCAGIYGRELAALPLYATPLAGTKGLITRQDDEQVAIAVV